MSSLQSWIFIAATACRGECGLAHSVCNVEQNRPCVSSCFAFAAAATSGMARLQACMTSHERLQTSTLLSLSGIVLLVALIAVLTSYFTFLDATLRLSQPRHP